MGIITESKLIYGYLIEYNQALEIFNIYNNEYKNEQALKNEEYEVELEFTDFSPVKNWKIAGYYNYYDSKYEDMSWYLIYDILPDNIDYEGIRLSDIKELKNEDFIIISEYIDSLICSCSTIYQSKIIESLKDIVIQDNIRLYSKTGLNLFIH